MAQIEDLSDWPPLEMVINRYSAIQRMAKYQIGNRVFSVQSEETKAHRQMDEQLGRFAGA